MPLIDFIPTWFGVNTFLCDDITSCAKFKKMYLGNNEIWKIFPSVETVAFYHPLGNFIYLNKMTEKQFVEVIKNPDKYPEHYGTIIHEMQHWTDHISTIWGQKKLLKIFKAFQSSFIGKETEMYKMKVLFNNFKEDRLATYYSENYNNIQGSTDKRWRYTFSTGIRYDNDGKIDDTKSIIFVRFNSFNEEPISRVPISIASLLETTAMNSEISSLMINISKLDVADRKIELKLLGDKIVKRLYNPDLTLYSVAVHTASNLLRISDPIDGYRISSMIATLSLNLPSSVFANLKVPADYTKEWNVRTKNLLNQEDRGFAFLCIAKNYFDKYGSYKEDEFSIDKLLEASDIIKIEELEKIVNEESASIDKEMFLDKNIFINLLITKIYTGNKLRNQRGLAQEKTNIGEFEMEKIGDLPYFICNDTYFDNDDIEMKDVVNKLSKVQPISREEWWRIFENCEKKIDEFSEICGV